MAHPELAAWNNACASYDKLSKNPMVRGQGGLLICRRIISNSPSNVRKSKCLQVRRANAVALSYSHAPMPKPPDALQAQMELYSPVDYLRYKLLFLHKEKRGVRALLERTRKALEENPGAQVDLFTIIHTQLLQCQTIHELLRIIDVALRRPESAQVVSRLEWQDYPIFNTGDQTRAALLRACNVIDMRFATAGLELPEYLAWTALKAAAFSYCPSGMKKWLKMWKTRGLRLSEDRLTHLLAMLSSGRQALPATVTKSTTTIQRMRQVVLGFDDAALHAPYHLGSYLSKSDWNDLFLVRWTRTLLDIGEVTAIWELWTTIKKRVQEAPKGLRQRLQVLFVSRLLGADGPEYAWKIVNECKLRGDVFEPWAQSALLEHLEFAKTWDVEFNKALESKWTEQVEAIEKELNISWVPSESGGYHVSKKRSLSSKTPLSISWKPSSNVSHHVSKKPDLSSKHQARIRFIKPRLKEG